MMPVPFYTLTHTQRQLQTSGRTGSEGKGTVTSNLAHEVASIVTETLVKLCSKFAQLNTFKIIELLQRV